jgi:uncharacterized membrane protein
LKKCEDLSIILQKPFNVKKNMPKPITDYVPNSLQNVQKRQAVWVWGVSLAIIFLWLAAIVSAPIFETEGVKSISQPIYRFFSYLCHQISSRSFHYHEHQFAVCVRCFGFYAGFLLGFMVYPFVRVLNNTDSFPRFWLFAAMIPMGVDVGLTFFDIWENTPLSRTVTGLILGFACAFFIIPALVEIRFFASQRFKRN